MTKVKKKTELLKNELAIAGYDDFLKEIIALFEYARHVSARAVNSVMTATYWEVGRRIVMKEQGGKKKADYGKQIIDNLAHDLTIRFGRGFGRRNVFQMRAFHLNYQAIVQTASAQLGTKKTTRKVQTVSAQFDFAILAKQFPLPWSHYVKFLAVKNESARSFYETEALRGGWTVRQLDRQIGSLFYERTALSRNKAAMLTKCGKPKPEDAVTPEEEIKDPLVLEFLGLEDKFSERDLEGALIEHLQDFLLELGNEFTFIGRQKRLRIDDQWFRIDLLLFHRRLRCLLILDLKLDKLTHADVGQMHLYCNYAREH